MKMVELTTASEPLSSYAKELGDDVIVLTMRNKPVAAIVSLKSVDRESLALSTNTEFLELIERARAEFAAGRKSSLEDVKREVLP